MKKFPKQDESPILSTLQLLHSDIAESGHRSVSFNPLPYPIAVTAPNFFTLARGILVRGGTRFGDGNFILAAVVPGDALPGPCRLDRDLDITNLGVGGYTAGETFQRILYRLLIGSLRLTRHGRSAWYQEADQRGE
jgi:hypothetical protein